MVRCFKGVFEDGVNEELCFACGKDNPIGLKLKFREEKESFITEFVPHKYFQSYPGILHGGIITTILDEAMGQYLFHKGYIAYTAEINVRFKNSIPVENIIFVSANIISHKRNLVEAKAEIKFENGVIAAEAKGKFIITGKR